MADLELAVCKHCGETIHLSATQWITIRLKKYPQYCPEEFQNQDKNKKHEPIKEN